MIRTRETPPAKAKALSQDRADLYLAGMRRTLSRPPTDEEGKALAWIAYGGAASGTAGALFLIELIFRTPAWANAPDSVPLLLLSVAASVICFAFSIIVSGPALQTLRRGRVHVFGGPARPLGQLDADQKRILGSRKDAAEMVLMANERTVLRIGRRFLPRLEPLRRPIKVSNDRGALSRPLTEDERQELGRLVRRFRTPKLSVFVIPLIALGACIISLVALEKADIIVRFIPLLLFGYLGGDLLRKLRTWESFARRLENDFADGRIQDGKLRSGLPWLIQDKPAPWRMAQPEVGVKPLLESEVMRTP